MNNIEKNLQLLINKSSWLGLEEKDINYAQDFLKNREYGLCFDTIVSQLYEYEISINLEVFILIKKIIDQMNLSKNVYSYIEELYNK